ncbi:MAG: hypothetical protein HY318_03060 [Armatimonadetes bacterium]|nr:hypothetical protein [Armatimonadota bacterium]
MNRVKERLAMNDGKPLLGIAVYTASPEVVEIAGMAGFDILWIEMEHAATSFREAGNLCRLGSGIGMLTMIRIPDSTRENVLRAAECGPDLLDLPMANTREVVEELVGYARYFPEGFRGSFGSSRAVRYGMTESMVESQRRINEEICLMAQIETKEAVERADEICSVPGLDAIFLGLGDLSATLGVTGHVDHPSVIEAAERAIASARKQGRLVGSVLRPQDAAFWTERGVDMLFVTNDIICMRTGIESIQAQIRQSYEA